MRLRGSWLRAASWVLMPAAVLVWGRAVAQAAPFAYITNTGSKNISVIDVATNTVVATITGTSPDGVAVSPDGTRVYITNDAANSVSIINTTTNAVVATVPVGNAPVGAAVSPDGTRVYVTNFNSNTVTVINTATNTVVFTVSVGTGPDGVIVGPDGTRVYVTNYSASSVSVINTATNTVVATVTGLNRPDGLIVSPDGTRVYASNSGSNSVAVINTATNTVVATVTVGSTPTGVAVTPDGSRVYVSVYSSNSVAVINTATNAVVTTVMVGSTPTGICATPDGSRVYVANNSSGNVSVIDTATNTVIATVAVGQRPEAFGQFIQPPAPATSPTTGDSSLPFTISNLGASSVNSSGTANSVRTGYAVIRPASGNTTPSGVAIFGFRANNALVSETGVPASLPLNTGRIYAEINPPVDTGVAIANPNSTAVTVNFSFTDGTGNTFGSGVLPIPANTQVAKFLDQPPFNAPVPFQGTFSFQSNQPVGVIALRLITNERNESLMSTLPVIDLSATTAGGAQVIPHFADGQGWTTQILLVNPSSSAITGNLQFSKPDGSPASVTIAGTTGANFSYAVPASGSQKLTTSGTSAVTTTGTVRVTTSGGAAPAPLVIFSYRTAGATVSEAGVPVKSGGALRMYVESSGTSGQSGSIQSGVAVANLSSAAADVTFEITKLDGSIASSPVTVSVSGSGQTSKLLGDLFPNLPNPFKGVLRMTAATPGISATGLRIHYNERTEFLITTTPPSVETNPPTSSVMLFPHLADGAGFTTQFILFSGTAGQSSSGTLNVFDPNGQPLNLGLR